jgi:hypothetical protein
MGEKCRDAITRDQYISWFVFFLNFTAIGFSLGRVCTVYSSFAFVYFCLGFYRFSFRFFIYDYIVVEHIPFKKKQFFGHIGRYTDREKIKQIHTHTHTKKNSNNVQVRKREKKRNRLFVSFLSHLRNSFLSLSLIEGYATHMYI